MDGELPDQERRSTGVIAWFVRNRVAANLVFFGVSLGGYLALGGIPREQLPKTSPPAVVVRVVLPGAEAEVVESRVLPSTRGSAAGYRGRAGDDRARDGRRRRAHARSRGRGGHSPDRGHGARTGGIPDLASGRGGGSRGLRDRAVSGDLPDRRARSGERTRPAPGFPACSRRRGGGTRSGRRRTADGLGPGTDHRDSGGEPDAVRVDLRRCGGRRPAGFRGHSRGDRAQRGA